MNKTPPLKGPNRAVRPRSYSLSPVLPRAKVIQQQSKGGHDLQNIQKSSRSLVRIKSQIISDNSLPRLTTSIADTLDLREFKSEEFQGQQSAGPSVTHIPALPEKVTRALGTKKREFLSKRKALVALQNTLVEQLASIKVLENRAGIPHDDKIDKLSILTLSNWPPHDLLLLLNELMEVPVSSEINSFLGSKVVEKVTEQLKPIHGDVVTICAELITSLKQQCHRPVHQTSKSKTTKSSVSMPNLDIAKLSALVENLGDKIKSRIDLALRLMKLPWLDRDTLIKRLDISQKELFSLKHKKTEEHQTECEDKKVVTPMEEPHRDRAKGVHGKKQITTDLEKQRLTTESIREVVAVENLLRVARARIVILEKELKITRAEVETMRRKQKENDQYIRQRENAYEARLKKIVEQSKLAETAVETLTRQRDALEVRVKELHEQTDKAEKKIKERNLEMMHIKAMEHNTDTSLSMKCVQLEKQVAELQMQLKKLREYSDKLVEVTNSKCLEYVPVKDDFMSERMPTPMEVDIYMELKSTRTNLKQVEDDLRKSKADKESLLKSLYDIARGEGEEKEIKLAQELVNRERKLCEMQTVVDELRQQLIKKDQTHIELSNTIQALRLEFIKARSLDTYNANDYSGIGIQEELMELYSRCEVMTRERTQLQSTAAARSLMLERYERAADMFAQIVNARQTLTDALEGKGKLGPRNISLTEMTRSLSALCENAVETWNALCNERNRVQRLETELANRNQHLEREAKIRTHLERRRAALIRALMGNSASGGVGTPSTKPTPKVKQPSRSPEKKKYLARIGSLFKF